MDTAILLELERAELAARERRLAGEAEAERIVADARARAARIERRVPARIARALTQRQRRHEAAAHELIADLEASIAELSAVAASTEREPDAVRDAAVAVVVAAILGEEPGA